MESSGRDQPHDLVTEEGLRELLAQAPELRQHLGDARSQQTESHHQMRHRHHLYHEDSPTYQTTVATEQQSSSLLQSLAGGISEEAIRGSDSTIVSESLMHQGSGSSLVNDDDGLPLGRLISGAQDHHLLNHHHGGLAGSDGGPNIVSQISQLPFLVKNEEIEQNLSEASSSSVQPQMSSSNSSHTGAPPNHMTGMSSHDVLQQHAALGHQAAVALHQAGITSTHHGSSFHPSAHVINPHLQHLQPHHMLHAHELAVGADPRHLHYGGGLPTSVGSPECLSTQKAVAFLAGPRERIHVLGNPVEHCLRCQQEGLGTTVWRPHRHIGELKIRYICERHFDDLESNHHFDIPLCPLCNQVLYLYEFNSMLGVSNARRLHKYVLKCANRHVLPLLDLFCQTKKGGERCNANFKLQWCYGTMVKRCEAQKNRDHDLWWVRYKNEWKQRRTIIRYKKDFLSHLTDAQRSLLLGLGVEGEPPPDPKVALGPTFDAIVSNAAGSPNGAKLKKRTVDRGGDMGHDGYLNADLGHSLKRRYRPSPQQPSADLYGDGSPTSGSTRNSLSMRTDQLGQPTDQLGSSSSGAHHLSDREGLSDIDPSLRHLVGAVVLPARQPDDPSTTSGMPTYATVQQQSQGGQTPPPSGSSTLQASNGYNSQQFTTADAAALFNIPPHMIITGTPTPPLQQHASGTSPVAVSCGGLVVQHPI